MAIKKENAIEENLRVYVDELIEILIGIARSQLTPDSDRIKVCHDFLNRIYGKPASNMNINTNMKDSDLKFANVGSIYEELSSRNDAILEKYVSKEDYKVLQDRLKSYEESIDKSVEKK